MPASAGQRTAGERRGFYMRAKNLQIKNSDAFSPTAGVPEAPRQWERKTGTILTNAPSECKKNRGANVTKTANPTTNRAFFFRTVTVKPIPPPKSFDKADNRCSPEHVPCTLTISDRLADLRRVLVEKFPPAERKPGVMLRTGFADLDAAEGGLRRAALTELSGTTGAGALFLQAILRAVCREQCFCALVDAARTFEPEACPAAGLARLLVVFCADAMQAVKAADLLLRDGNLALILLDLQAVPPAQLRRIPANTWHRFQRLAEQTTAAVVVLTAEPIVEAAQVRIAGAGGWTLAAQRRWRHELIAEAAWRVFPRRPAVVHSPAWAGGHATA